MPRTGIRFSRFLTVLCLAAAWPILPAVYHLDPAGDDSADGLSPAAAWKSLAHANAAILVPGDSLLLKAGGKWIGQLRPKGSGSAAKPIRIAAYGEGAKPMVDGNGRVGEAVLYLSGQDHFEISDLDLANAAATAGDRRGVLVNGPARGIHLRNLTVHDVKGSPGQELADKATGGIAFTGGGEDISVDGCEIRGVDDIGLTTNGGAYTRFAARENVIHDVAKNAIIFRGGDSTCVIEHNVCFRTCARVDDGNTIFSVECSGTRFQFNEGFENLSSTGRDGSLYDADINGASGTLWQYSYSHDNAEGLMWFCTNAQDTGIQVRYNISNGDHGKIFCFSFPLGHADLYNNTVRIAAGAQGWLLYEKQNQYGYGFYNNVIADGSNATAYVFANADREFGANLFSGHHGKGEPADAAKLVLDPLLLAPETAGQGLASLAGFRTRVDSPCRNSGRAMPRPGLRDFFGNPLYHGHPDRGAYEAPANEALRPASPGLRFDRLQHPGSNRFLDPGHARPRDARGRLAVSTPPDSVFSPTLRFRAESAIALSLGLLSDTSLTSLKRAWRAENTARAQAVAEERILPGPISLSLAAFAAFRQANLRVRARQLLSAGAQEGELRAAYTLEIAGGIRFREPYAVWARDFAGSRPGDTLDLDLRPRDSEGEDPQATPVLARSLQAGASIRIPAAQGKAGYRAPAASVTCLRRGERMLDYTAARGILLRDRSNALYESEVARMEAGLRAPGGYAKF